MTLARLEARDAVPNLVEALGDPDSGVRSNAARALGQLRAEETVPPLTKLLQDRDSAVRYQAVSALRTLRAGDSIPDIVVLLKDEHPSVRWITVVTLADLRAKEWIPHLVVELLDDESAPVRRLAAEVLGHFRVRTAIPGLLTLLSDDDVDVRGRAMVSLGKLGAKEAIPKLVEISTQLPRDEDGALRWDAIDGLVALRAREAIADIARLLEDEIPHLRIWSAHALCRLGSLKGIPVLLDGEEEEPVVINSLRRPDVWRRLRDAKPEGAALEGSLETVLTEIARRADLRIEWETIDPEARAGRAWISPGWRSHLDALTEIAWREEFSFILESDRLRVLPEAEAVTFWRRWWQEEAGRPEPSPPRKNDEGR